MEPRTFPGPDLPTPSWSGLLPGSLIPFFLFFWHFQANLTLGRPADSLWVCHVAVLILATGMLVGNVHLIRVAALFGVSGLPAWLFGLVTGEVWSLSSTCSHLGGTTVALMALRSVRAGRGTWVHAVAIFLGLQLVCRLATAPELNVNLAHHVYPGTPFPFPGYWSYWMTIIPVGAGTLWVAELFLRKLFPATGPR